MGGKDARPHFCGWGGGGVKAQAWGSSIPLVLGGSGDLACSYFVEL